MKDTLTLIPSGDGKYLIRTGEEKPLWIEQIFVGGPTIWAASQELATAFELQQIIKMYPENPIEFEKSEE